MKTMRVLMVLVLVVTLLAALNLAVSSAKPTFADSGGVSGASNAVTLLDGTTGYTTSVAYSDPFESRYYGSVQVMAAAAMTSTLTMTVTPQFSLQNVPCGQVTEWFTQATYMPYQLADISTLTGTAVITGSVTITSGLEVSGTLVTTTTNYLTATNYLTTSLTAGAVSVVELPERFTVIGPGVTQREVGSGGICFRAMLTWSSEGETFTPTIVVRGLNRNR